MTPSHLRIAAGAWVFAACLLLNAGAVAAFADPGSGKDADGPAATNHPANASASHVGHPSSPTSAGATPSTKAGGAVEHGPHPPGTDKAGQPDPTTTVAIGPRRKMTVAASVEAPAASDAGPASDPVPDPQPPTGTVSTAIATAATLVPQPTTDPDPSTAAADPSTAAPVSATLESLAPATPSNDPPAPTTEQNAPSAEATAAASPPPAVVESVPDPGATASQDAAASSTDVGTVGADVIPPSVTEVVPTPPPTVAIAPPVATPIAEVQTVAAVARSRSGPNSLSPMQIFRLMTGASWFSSAGGATAVSSARQTGVPSLLTPSASHYGDATAAALTFAKSTAAPAPSNAVGTLPEDLRVFFHSYGQLVIAASLSAVAAAALPGLAGMAIPALAGVRIGYRQAKAARNLHASGIVRFAGSGPLGIVRSGSVVSLRTGGSRVGRPTGSDASDRVA